jgi:hypothetical protein
MPTPEQPGHYGPQPGQYGPQPGHYGPQPVPHTGQPKPYPIADPAAPYGRDPVTGKPLSNKSKLAAGVLQFLWGGPFGAGNLYLGDVKLCLLHLAAFFGGMFLVLLGILSLLFTMLGAFLAFGSVAFAWWETYLIFTDRMPDKDGRQLR